MKYPIVEVKSIPHGFKHGEIAVVVDFAYLHEEAYLDGGAITSKSQYLAFVKHELLTLLDSLMTLYRPELMLYEDRYIIALKDNTDLYKLKDTINDRMLEILYYTGYTLEMKAYVCNAMLVEAGRDLPFFKVKKAGDILEESDAYQAGVIVPTGKMDVEELSLITPYSEFILKNTKE